MTKTKENANTAGRSTPRVLISQTAWQTGYGAASCYKIVRGLTPDEQAAAREGAIVVYDCGRLSGGGNRTGTTLRIAIPGSRAFYPRVPTAEQLVKISTARAEAQNADAIAAAWAAEVQEAEAIRQLAVIWAHPRCFGTMALSLEALENAGLIECHLRPHDMRLRVTLSAAGRRLAARIDVATP